MQQTVGLYLSLWNLTKTVQWYINFGSLFDKLHRYHKYRDIAAAMHISTGNGRLIVKVLFVRDVSVVRPTSYCSEVAADCQAELMLSH